MHIATLNHDDMSCEIDHNSTDGHVTGKVRYRVFEVGLISGRDEITVRSQFEAICALIDDGGMLRRGIIMLGYHNGAFKGDVLLVDGEIIGEWVSDGEEWCHFTADGASKTSFSAPSPWMLHDSIADWQKK